MIPIVIVEDEFLVRVGLRSMINWNFFGFYIAGDASNGQEGFELYEKYHPYLIITDIRMSPVSGLEMMQKIRNIDKEVKFIVISAYNDFSYAQQAITYGVELYLSKSTFRNDDLEEILPKIRDSYQKGNPAPQPVVSLSLEVFDSAFPATTDTEAIRQRLSQNNLDNGTRFLMASRFDRSRTHNANIPIQNTILKNLLESAEIPCQFYQRKDFLVCICKTDKPETLSQIAGEAHKTLQNYTMEPCFFGISSPLNENRQLFRALSEACLACNEFIFSKEIICRVFSAGYTTENISSLNLDTTLEELMSYVFSANHGETLYTLEKIVYSCQNYRTLERALFTVLSAFIEYDNSNSLSMLLESFLRKDDLAQIIVSLKNWIFSLPFNTIPAGGAGKEYVDTVISYIRNHLEENLSNQYLASMVHLSPNYLGKIFYQNTGVSITQYISNYRINQACDLLLQTNLPINTIGTMVGINNPHYFSRLFREMIGQSPSKYRSQNQEEQEI